MEHIKLQQLIQEVINELSEKSVGVEEFLAHANKQKYPYLKFPSFNDLKDYVLDASGKEFNELKDEAGIDEAFFIGENEIDYYVDRYGNEFQTVNVNYLQYPGSVTVKYDNGEPVEYKGNFQANLKSGIIKRLDSEINEAFFIGENKTIECEKCGWKWELEDNGVNDNPYLCHKCNYDNSYRYNDDIDEYDVDENNLYEVKDFIKFMKEYKTFLAESSCDCVMEAEYKGRKVALGKPMQGDIKKFKVYVKNNKGKVVKVNFGFGGKSAHGKRMVIKKHNPVHRNAYRKRHHCDNPGPRWKANYWSCRKW